MPPLRLEQIDARRPQTSGDERKSVDTPPPTPRRHSAYANLESPLDRKGAPRGSVVTPAAAAFASPLDLHYPFLSPFSITSSSSSENLSGLVDDADDGSPQATWPAPSAYSVSPVPSSSRVRLPLSRTPPPPQQDYDAGRKPRTSLSVTLSRAMRPRSLTSSKLTRFEVALVDRLADFLEQEDTMQTIREASGVISAELTGSKGARRFVCCGSASAVNKARQLVDASGISPLTTPLSDRSAESYYPGPASPASTSPGDSARSIPLLGGASSLGNSPSSGPALPAIGDFASHRDAYVGALVDELETWIARRSLVRVKILVGTQGWLRTEGQLARERDFSVEELERVSLTPACPFGSPHFVSSLSRSAAHALLDRVCASGEGFECTKQSSQVYLTLLDKRRAVYGVATAALKGSDLRALGPGETGSGTLSLKKCSTLPSKPFSLSIAAPHVHDEEGEGEAGEMHEGTDLRVKVLADKAATSPSEELSTAMQLATWCLDSEGVFAVDAVLNPQRFSPNQTRVTWRAKERWENEVELSSPALNAALADCSLNYLRRKWDRCKIERLVEELVEWAAGVVDAREGEAERGRGGNMGQDATR
ncbi:hypothetical protein JCM10450v2_008115 [Rhodotorula kratochvilovae]